MAFLQSFISARTTVPDNMSLLNGLIALDATAFIVFSPQPPWIIGKSTAWTVNQIAAAQSVLDTSAAVTPELTAQSVIDNWSIDMRAFALALIDQLNIIRAALPAPLPPITPAQAIAAIVAKAATL
jgi:hypothetical protein